MKYNLVVCGGTFDHFHKGHRVFLSYVFSVGKRIIVGVTSDEYVAKSKIKNQKSKLETFEKRKQAVLKFVEKEKAANKVEIVKINDLFGPTLAKDLAIDGIVVSAESKKGAEIINQRRKKLGLKELKLFIAPQVLAEDGKPISSARIRNGEINRAGRLYIKPVWLKTDLVLPENLRAEFQKPFGILDFNVLKHQNKFSWIVSVGDVTTKKLNELGIDQRLSVIDFKVARKVAFSSLADLSFAGDEKVMSAENPAGHITHDLFSTVLDIFNSDPGKKIILKIEGEEDLAVLPLILASPLSTIIYYGQPNEGLVRVLVSEEIKEKAYKLVNKFEMLK
ncbi:MAG: transf like protein [Candidatus Levybacteria bacterium]|nr:transf like protein [Candidatus Levybacteria bacterium]